MDTATVLEIIRMLDTQMHNLEQAEDIWPEEYQFGVKHLSFIRDHLQEYIEQQVTYAENNLGNGE